MCASIRIVWAGLGGGLHKRVRTLNIFPPSSQL